MIAINIVVVLINPKIFLNNLRWLHPKCFGHLVDISICDNWTNGAAAVGAIEAVYLLKNLVVQFLKKVINLRFMILQYNH